MPGPLQEIYRAVVPKLREKGIVTLAQAERAVRGLSARMTEEAQSGWHDMGQGGDARDGSRIAEYVRIDSFAYRHRVADLMRHPPLTVGSDRPVRAALAAMMEKKVSSLFLPPETADGPDGNGDGIGNGIVTERDIMRAIDRDGPAALDAPVGNLGQRPLVTIHRDEFVYRAIARMSGGGFRHLGVVDEGGVLCGALSARDLLRQRAGDAVALGDSIESARSRFELGRVWSQLTAVARALVFEEVDARTIASMISRELRALTARACELAEAEMAEAGLGEAPAPYALLVLGSGGRGESLLAMDSGQRAHLCRRRPGRRRRMVRATGPAHRRHSRRDRRDLLSRRHHGFQRRLAEAARRLAGDRPVLDRAVARRGTC